VAMYVCFISSVLDGIALIGQVLIKFSVFDGEFLP
jgi:hypothetical protein